MSIRNNCHTGQQYSIFNGVSSRRNFSKRVLDIEDIFRSNVRCIALARSRKAWSTSLAPLILDPSFLHIWRPKISSTRSLKYACYTGYGATYPYSVNFVITMLWLIILKAFSKHCKGYTVGTSSADGKNTSRGGMSLAGLFQSTA